MEDEDRDEVEVEEEDEVEVVSEESEEGEEGDYLHGREGPPSRHLLQPRHLHQRPAIQ